MSAALPLPDPEHDGRPATPISDLFEAATRARIARTLREITHSRTDVTVTVVRGLPYASVSVQRLREIADELDGGDTA